MSCTVWFVPELVQHVASFLSDDSVRALCRVSRVFRYTLWQEYASARVQTLRVKSKHLKVVIESISRPAWRAHCLVIIGCDIIRWQLKRPEAQVLETWHQLLTGAAPGIPGLRLDFFHPEAPLTRHKLALAMTARALGISLDQIAKRISIEPLDLQLQLVHYPVVQAVVRQEQHAACVADVLGVNEEEPLIELETNLYTIASYEVGAGRRPVSSVAHEFGITTSRSLIRLENPKVEGDARRDIELGFTVRSVAEKYGITTNLSRLKLEMFLIWGPARNEIESGASLPATAKKFELTSTDALKRLELIVTIGFASKAIIQRRSTAKELVTAHGLSQPASEFLHELQDSVERL